MIRFVFNFIDSMCYTGDREDTHSEQSNKYIPVEADACKYTCINYKIYKVKIIGGVLDDDIHMQV